MRKIVAGFFLSLDGVMESPEKWHFPYFNEEMGQAVAAQAAGADAMLLGRATYQEFAGYWPTAGDDPMAAQMNETPKYVVSSTLKTLEWQNSTLISGNVTEEIARLKQGPGRDISITGSATLVRSLLREGLLDELRLLPGAPGGRRKPPAQLGEVGLVPSFEGQKLGRGGGGVQPDDPLLVGDELPEQHGIRVRRLGALVLGLLGGAPADRRGDRRGGGPDGGVPQQVTPGQETHGRPPVTGGLLTHLAS
ncbi:dihydrofolate reductase family protein [Streptosporangium sandarakinum]